MAAVRLRTAVVVVLTILAAAVFSLMLLPRLRRAPDQSEANGAALPAESALTEVDKPAADKQAMWHPQAQAKPEATWTNVLPPGKDPVAQRPGVMAERVGLPRSKSFGSPENDHPRPAGIPGDQEAPAELGDDGLLLRKLKEISIESRPPQVPQRPNSDKLDSEKTPNSVKYERLKSLLGRMHDPHVEGVDRDLGKVDDRPKLTKILAKEAVERLAKKYDNERLERGKGKEREMSLLFGTDNEQERGRGRARERQLMFGTNNGQEKEGERRQKSEGEAGTNLNRNGVVADWSRKPDSHVISAVGNTHRHEEPTKATSPVSTTTMAATTPVPSAPPAPLPPAPPPNPVKDLPSMKRGSVEIRPERLPPPAHSSDIYYSLLTAPVYHNLRFSLQYLTWLQTVDPKQVSLIETPLI